MSRASNRRKAKREKKLERQRAHLESVAKRPIMQVPENEGE